MAPLPTPERPIRGIDADLPLGTILAFAWLTAVLATSLTLWILVAFVGG